MKKELITSLRTLVVALVIGVGTFLVGAWSEPTGSAPEDNTQAPLNESTTTQTKTGILNVDNEADTATTSTDILSVFGLNVLSETVYVGDDELGTGNVDVHVTGNVGVNLDGDYIPSDIPQTEVHVEGTARISSLDSSTNPYATYSSALCIGTDAKLVLCDPGSAAVGTPSWHTLGIVSPYGDPGQGCNDWLSENYPLWDGTNAHKRVRINHDGDFVDWVAGTTTYLEPGYGGCIYGNILSSEYAIQDNAEAAPTDDIYFPAPWGDSGSYTLGPPDDWGIPQGVGTDGIPGFFYQMELYY